jgi:hypothetical protein
MLKERLYALYVEEISDGDQAIKNIKRLVISNMNCDG